MGRGGNEKEEERMKKRRGNREGWTEGNERRNFWMLDSQ